MGGNTPEEDNSDQLAMDQAPTDQSSPQELLPPLNHTENPSLKLELGDDDNNPFHHSLLGLDKEDDSQRSDLNGQGVQNDESVLLYTNAPQNPGKSPQNAPKSPENSELSGAQSPVQAPMESIQINHESRISRLLRPNSNVKVQITEANNSSEGMANSLKKYIVYTIKLINEDNPKEEIQIRRRYSDFESLREILTKIFPLVIIPPIPPKNYFNLSMLNNFVGSKGQPANGTSGNNGNHMNKPELANDYSYINSTHLNSNKLIEHRKRLLTNFLNNCLHIDQIRHLEFFTKFLDPNTNWQDEINLILSQLPKDIYHLNPENGLKTDSIYSNLPYPSGNKMSFLKPLLNNSKKLTKKTNKLINGGGNNEQESQPQSQRESQEGQSPEETSPNGSSDNLTNGSAGTEKVETLNTSHLDDINKKIMDNFIGLANDYTELGSVFNSFSLILADSPIIRTKSKETDDDKDNAKLNQILDKMGQVFDRSYITINSLINDLETKFSEPLGEAVQYTTILNFVQKFQKRKIKQKRLLDDDLKDKRTTLDQLLKAEEESSRMESVITNDQVAKNNSYNINNRGSTENGSSSRFKFPNMNSIKKITQYVSDIIDQHPEETRKQRISELKTKITTLEKCQGIMLEDISYITDELSKNFNHFHNRQLKVIYDILLCYNKFLVSWAKKNLDIWEELREEIVDL